MHCRASFAYGNNLIGMLFDVNCRRMHVCSIYYTRNYKYFRKIWRKCEKSEWVHRVGSSTT